MPIYRYACQTCGLESDEFRRIANRHDALECVCGGAMKMKLMAPAVQPDIQPYRSVVIDKETGKFVNIESRRQHREFLRRNDYVEVGNDFTPPPKRDDGPADAPMMSVDEMKRRGFVEEDL